MPSEPAQTEFEPRKRLHRLSWIFVSIEYVKQFIFPVLAAIFLGARQDGGAWTAFLVLPLVGGALWHQWIYRYDFGPRSLVIREGLFFRNTRNIEYRRIENVDTERNLLHRLFNVAQVRVETSSGGSSEAVVRVLDMAAVQEMRERIFEARSTMSAEAKPVVAAQAETLLHLPPAELLRFGLIDNRGMIVVAAIFGLASQVGSEQLVKRWMEPFFKTLPVDSFTALAPTLQTFFVFSTIVGLIAGTRILSVLFAFITLHDFRLAQSQDDLRVQYGLLTRISLTLRRPRIQAVHRKSSILHRLFRRVSLTVDLAGGVGGQVTQEGNNAQARELWLAPVSTYQKADELVRIALPAVRLDEAKWQGLAPGARGRLFRLLSIVWLLAAIPASVTLSSWLVMPWIALPVIPLLWLHAHLYVKYTGWALHEDFFAVRRGWLTRRLSVTPRNRVQAVRLSESPFDRRYGMASLLVDTAGARSRQLRIPYLDGDAATELMRALQRS